MANKNNTPERVYHETFVIGSPIPQKYKHSFSGIINKDYPGKKYGFSPRILDILCIDMDSIEKDNNGDDNNTMDMVTGIAQFDDNRRVFKNDKFLPVELKLGCKSIDEISKTDLLRKDEHTRDLLNSYSVSVDAHSVFLFTKNVAPYAKNIKSRWEKETNGKKIKTWEMKSPEEYNTYIQFEDDFPYKTMTDVEGLKDKINNLFSDGDIDGLIDFIESGKRMAEAYRYKHNNLNECGAIADALSESIKSLIGKNQGADIDEYLKMLEEEISSLYNS
jgi:hypothetical protein